MISFHTHTHSTLAHFFNTLNNHGHTSFLSSYYTKTHAEMSFLAHKLYCTSIWCAGVDFFYCYLVKRTCNPRSRCRTKERSVGVGLSIGENFLPLFWRRRRRRRRRMGRESWSCVEQRRWDKPKFYQIGLSEGRDEPTRTDGINGERNEQIELERTDGRRDRNHTDVWDKRTVMMIRQTGKRRNV